MLARSWAGRVNGTSVGNMSADLSSSGNNVSGIVRANIEGEGMYVAQAVGTFSGSELKLQLSGEQTGVPDSAGTGEVEGVLQQDGSISGTWTTSSGGGGPFVMWPHPGLSRRDTSTEPRQVHQKTKNLGWVRLGRSEVVSLLQSLRNEFSTGSIIVTLEVNGVERTIYAADFEAKTGDVPISRMLRINAQQIEAPGFNRILTVTLGSEGNSVRAQSIDEQWAVGIVETTFLRLRRSTMWSATLLNRTGILFFVFLGLLVVGAPELEWPQRIVFAAITLLAMRLTGSALQNFVPQAELYPSREHVSMFRRIGSTMSTIAITIVGALVAGAVLAWLTGDLTLPNLPRQ